MARTWLFCLLTIAAGAQAQPNWKFVGAEAGRPGATVTGAPFSADVTTETNMTLQDGNRIHQVTKLRFYRDSEGRTRREQSLNNLGSLASNTNMPTVVFINDPVAGVNYALNPASKTATRSASGRAAAAIRDARMRMGLGNSASQQNARTESLGSKTLEGVTADGTRTTISIPAGQEGNEQPMQSVIETWYSADLQTVVLSKRNDPRTGETVTRLTNIVRAEPLHSLFELPADYSIDPLRGARKELKKDSK